LSPSLPQRLLPVVPALGGAARLLPALAAFGLLDFAAVTLITVATTKGMLAIVGVLAALYPIVTVAPARYLSGERLRASQGVGTVIALAGVALISSTA